MTVPEESEKDKKRVKVLSKIRDDLAESLSTSRSIYWQRLAGFTHLWSASTRCIVCGDWWMWGIQDNLRFICPNCKKSNGEQL